MKAITVKPEVKSVSGVSLTENALRVLEKRYLKKDAKGQVVETPEDMFRRAAKAIASAEPIYNPEADAGVMEEEFYRGRLTENHGVEVLVPNQQQRAIVHRVIYDELCRGRIEQSSRQHYLAIIDQLANRGAEGIILGCTEIGLLVKAEDSRVPLFDTTKIHAEAAVAYALEP